jgi:hypothetical protein
LLPVALLPVSGPQGRSLAAAKGDYSLVKNGMTVDLTGTTQDQYNTIKAGYQKAIDASSKDNLNKVYFTGAPKQQ